MRLSVESAPSGHTAVDMHPEQPGSKQFAENPPKILCFKMLFHHRQTPQTSRCTFIHPKYTPPTSPPHRGVNAAPFLSNNTNTREAHTEWNTNHPKSHSRGRCDETDFCININIHMRISANMSWSSGLARLCWLAGRVRVGGREHWLWICCV